MEFIRSHHDAGGSAAGTRPHQRSFRSGCCRCHRRLQIWSSMPPSALKLHRCHPIMLDAVAITSRRPVVAAARASIGLGWWPRGKSGGFGQLRWFLHRDRGMDVRRERKEMGRGVRKKKGLRVVWALFENYS